MSIENIDDLINWDLTSLDSFESDLAEEIWREVEKDHEKEGFSLTAFLDALFPIF
jgi:hypothetical protein